MKRNTVSSQAKTYLQAVKDTFQDEKEKYNSFLTLLKDYGAKRVAFNDLKARVKDLFNGHDDLLLGFNQFLPERYRITLPEDEKPKKNPDFIGAVKLIKKIELRFGSDNPVYKRFLDILKMYRHESKPRSDVHREVTLLFQGHEDLLADFVHIFSENSGSGQLPGNLKVKENKRIQDNENNERTERAVAFGSKNIRSQQNMNVTINDSAKGIHELDLSKSAQCSRSYRLLPEDYPIQIASYRNAIAKSVLNDHWVSVTSGSEDHPFENMRKNPYEENLFRCEDDMCQLDVLLESVTAAIKSVEILLEKINTNFVESPICITEHLSELNLRCIERLYGDHGLEVIKFLKKNPRLALPMILTRLKKKQEEWTRCRSDFKKVWAEVYAENLPKSLDHRSFDFKQQDSQNLSSKVLVAEIKDISERKKCKEDPLVVGDRPSLIADMEFSYSDTQVHADLYQLIKYYCEKTGTTERLDKVMKLWVTFLEPISGVPSNETMKDVCEAMMDISTLEDFSVDTTETIQQDKLHDGTSMVNETMKDVCEPMMDISTLEDFSVDTRETIQQDKLHDGTSMVNEDSKNDTPNNTRVFYGNDSFYVLFRLHQILYERIQSAKIHSEQNTSTDSFTRFTEALYSLLDGSSDNDKFEDECRTIIGEQSYVLFTLDKLVQKLVKHLHTVADDETDTKLLKLYADEICRKPRSCVDTVYHGNAQALLHDQNIYRIEYSFAKTCLSIQLMNSANDQTEVEAVPINQ